MGEKIYKVIDGTSFDVRTPNQVCDVLLRLMNKDHRVRVFYGDADTGRDWCEFNDTMGYVVRTGGKVKIPILLHNSRSIGGGSILDHCIVKIAVGKHVLYKHPRYHVPIKKDGNRILFTDTGEVLFDNPNGVDRVYDFLLGKRNSH